MSMITPAEPYAPALAEVGDDFDWRGARRDLSGAPPLFVETPSARARRMALGLAYPLRPVRIRLLPHLLWLTTEFLVRPEAAEARLKEPKYREWQGLVGVSDDLSPAALLDRYRRGMFPLCHVGPMKWFSPNTRPVLPPEQMRIEKSLRRTIRKQRYRVTFDTDFAAVMRACAEPRPGKTPLTWITPRVMRAFWELHITGHAHSVEVWDAKRTLIGGSYGLACGGIFFGESKFSRVRDASKIASATLNMHLARWGFNLCEAKWMTDHLASLGFRSIGREEFLRILREHAWKPGRVGRWAVDETLDVSQWQTRG
jgi:leucyl/phenylalanyl-tRNA--protein transferase